MTTRRRLPAVHPGTLIHDELREIRLTAAGLARALRVPGPRVRSIVNGKRAITVDTAIRLARYFGTSAQY